MTPSKSLIVFGVLTIAFGGVWLLSTLNMLPDAKWLTTVFLAGCGVLTFISGGVSRMTVVLGPWFFAAAFMSALRHLGYVEFRLEVPILVIIFGVLLLVAAMMPPDRPAAGGPTQPQPPPTP